MIDFKTLSGTEFLFTTEQLLNVYIYEKMLLLLTRNEEREFSIHGFKDRKSTRLNSSHSSVSRMPSSA